MLQKETLKELHSILELDDFIDLVSVQTALHSIEPRSEDLERPNAFTDKVLNNFMALYDVERQRADIALKRLLRAADFETATELAGLGNAGYAKRSLKSLVLNLDKEGIWIKEETA